MDPELPGFEYLVSSRKAVVEAIHEGVVPSLAHGVTAHYRHTSTTTATAKARKLLKERIGVLAPMKEMVGGSSSNDNK